MYGLLPSERPELSAPAGIARRPPQPYALLLLYFMNATPIVCIVANRLPDHPTRNGTVRNGAPAVLRTSCLKFKRTRWAVSRHSLGQVCISRLTALHLEVSPNFTVVAQRVTRSTRLSCPTLCFPLRCEDPQPVHRDGQPLFTRQELSGLSQSRESNAATGPEARRHPPDAGSTSHESAARAEPQACNPLPPSRRSAGRGRRGGHGLCGQLG